MHILMITAKILSIPLTFITAWCLFWGGEYIIHKIHDKLKKYESTRIYQCIRKGIKEYFLFEFDEDD